MKIYEEIFQEYKKYIEKYSIYKPRVVKYNTNKSTYFPIITFVLSDTKDTNEVSLNFIEKYDAYYFTIDVYSKEISTSTGKIASQIINDELTELTLQFFGDKLRMKRTLCKPTPNLDTSILRRTIQYQSYIGNVRKNIIRR